MKSTREKVLQMLVSSPRSTIVQIAKLVGINAISVRHHLTSLQADGLISSEEERHGIGRPRLVYFLTDIGMEKFPTRYYRLTNNLLSELKATMSETELKRIFRGMADKFAEEYEPIFRKLDFDKKLMLLKQLLTKEGYDLILKQNGKDYQIKEISCPFYQIGKDHPEICLFDKALIAKLLDIPEEKMVHVRDGDNRCIFKFSNP